MSAVELLSPAGCWESLKAAVSNGADAVYFGGGSFNARARARNFSEENLRNAISFCHKNSTYAYLTLNTLVKNPELNDFAALLEDAYCAGVDAVIIQDMSFIDAIKDSFSDLGIHLSTQAGIFNSYYLPLISCADRVILPREMSINQIKSFLEKTRIPVEVFVQGALCFSIGGRCLMSSFLGGRSANRGLCAQPCRKKYNGKYPLSSQDLCLAHNLEQIVSAGVSSVKIEGRLRSPQYVAAATSLYRRILDGRGFDPACFKDLELAFSRGYTRGLMFKECRVSTEGVPGKQGLFLGVLGSNRSITLEEDIFLGDGLKIESRNGSHGDLVRKIRMGSKELEFGYTGQTVSLDINAAEGDKLFLTAGRTRRKKYNYKKTKLRLSVHRQQKNLVLRQANEKRLPKAQLFVKVHRLDDALSAAEEKPAAVFYNLLSKDYPFDDARILPYIPGSLSEWDAKQAVDLLSTHSFPSALCADAGVACSISEGAVYLDLPGNAFNESAVSFWNERGITPTISPELSFNEMKEFSDMRFLVFSHGRLPLMTSKYFLECDELKDEKNYIFPVRKEHDSVQVLNSIPQSYFTVLPMLLKIGVRGFLIDVEDDAGSTVKAYLDALEGKSASLPGEFTLGHFRTPAL